MDDRWIGIKFPVDVEIYSSSPHADRYCDPPRLRSNGPGGFFPVVKRPSRASANLSLYLARVYEKLELCMCCHLSPWLIQGSGADHILLMGDQLIWSLFNDAASDSDYMMSMWMLKEAVVA